MLLYVPTRGSFITARPLLTHSVPSRLLPFFSIIDSLFQFISSTSMTFKFKLNLKKHNLIRDSIKTLWRS